MGCTAKENKTKAKYCFIVKATAERETHLRVWCLNIGSSISISKTSSKKNLIKENKRPPVMNGRPALLYKWQVKWGLVGGLASGTEEPLPKCMKPRFTNSTKVKSPSSDGHLLSLLKGSAEEIRFPHANVFNTSLGLAYRLEIGDRGKLRKYTKGMRVYEAFIKLSYHAHLSWHNKRDTQWGHNYSVKAGPLKFQF